MPGFISSALRLSAPLGLILLASPALATAPIKGHSAPAAPPSRQVHIDPSGKPQSGMASFYGPRVAGKTTASGAPMSPNKLTAASKTLPLGTKAKVVNKENGKSADVTITDRGPFVKNRILDVSSKAATKLGMKSDGVSKVKVTPLAIPKRPPQVRRPAG